MILGMSVAAFTTLHVIISLIAIGAGLLLLPALLGSRRAGPLTVIYLAFTILTSVTGFFFHSAAIGPPHIVGAISLVVLAVCLFALYGKKLSGIWRPTYVATAVLALYLNCFVLVAQAFDKIAPLHALAPTGKEPAFAVAQGLTLLAFAVMGFLSVKRYHPAPGLAA